MSSDTPDAGPDQSMLPLGPDDLEGSRPRNRRPASAPAAPTTRPRGADSTAGRADPCRRRRRAPRRRRRRAQRRRRRRASAEASQPSAGGARGPSGSNDTDRRHHGASGPRPRPRPASISDDLITVEDHLERILRGVGPLEAYDQPIVESLGLPLHENFIAPIDLPRFANSSMDGYAVRAEDVAGATSEAPGDAAGRRRDRRRVGQAVRDQRRHRGQDHDRSAHPARRRHRHPVRAAPTAATRASSIHDAVAGRRQRPHAGQRRPGRRPRAARRDRARAARDRPAGRRSARRASRPDRGRASSSSPPAASCASRAPTSTTTRSTTATATCWPRPCAPPARSRTGSARSTTTRASFRKLLAEQLVRADLVVTSGGVSMGEKDVVKETLSALGHGRLRQGGHAARQAAGIRPGLRRADADHHAAGQPGVGLRVVRGVRAAGHPAADGPHALPAPDGARRARRPTSSRGPASASTFAASSRSPTGAPRSRPSRATSSHLHRRAGEGQRADRRRGGRDGPQHGRHGAHPRAGSGRSDG